MEGGGAHDIFCQVSTRGSGSWVSVPFQKRQPSSKQLRQSARSHSGEDACISRKKNCPPHLVGADVPVQLRRLLDPPVQLGQTELQPAPPAAQRGPLSQPSPLPAAGGKGGRTRVNSLDQYAASFRTIQKCSIVDSPGCCRRSCTKRLAQ